MKHFISTFTNKLPTAPIGSSLLFSILFCIHLVTHTFQQTILRITEIFSEIVNGILEGIGSFKQTIAPNNELSSKIAQEIAEARNLRESEIINKWREDLRQENIENDNKFIIVVMLFTILMLFPYLSDSSINTSILPFLVGFKQRLQLIKLTEEFKDKLTFLFYLSVVIIIILLEIISIPDYSGSESVWLSAGIFGRLGKLISRPSTPSSSIRPSTPDHLAIPEVDKVLKTEMDREIGYYPQLQDLPPQPIRDSVPTVLDFPGITIETAPIEDEVALKKISNQAVTGSSSTIYITKEQEAPRDSTATTSDGYGEVTGRFYNADEELNFYSSSADEQLSPFFQREKNRIQDEITRRTRAAVYRKLTGFNDDDNPFVDVPSTSDLFLPLFLITSSNLTNKFSKESQKDLMIYIISSLFIFTIILMNINFTDITDNTVTSVSIFSTLKTKLTNRFNIKPKKEIELTPIQATVNNTPPMLATGVNNSTESINDDWHSCRTHISTESVLDSGYWSDIWHSCAESFTSDTPSSDSSSTSEVSPRRKLHFSLNNGEQSSATVNNGSRYIDPTTGFITDDHPALIDFHRALTYRQLFYSNTEILVSDITDELFIPFFLIFSNTLLGNKIKNSKLYLRLINSRTYEYLKTSLLFKIFITSILSLTIKYLILKLWSISIDPITTLFIPLLVYYEPILLEAWSTRYFKIIFECFLPNSIHLDSAERSYPNQDESIVKNKLKKLRKWVKNCIKSWKNRFGTDVDSYHTANSSFDSLIIDDDYHSAIDWDLNNSRQHLVSETNRRSLPPVSKVYPYLPDWLRSLHHISADRPTTHELSSLPWELEWNRQHNGGLKSRFSDTESAVSTRVTHMTFALTSSSDADSSHNTQNRLKGMLKKALHIVKK